MNKTQKMKNAAVKARNQNKKNRIKNILLFPWRVIKSVWRFLCHICRAIWNWLKSIDIVGMVNLTLLVVIIVLFSSLIVDIVCCKKCASLNGLKQSGGVIATSNAQSVNNRKVVKRTFSKTLPLKMNKQTNIKPKIKTIGVAKPQIIKEISMHARELPKQVLGGDVIIENHPSSPVLSNGVKVNGNLFIQNMRKYTIPCDAKINGHLFVRNVARLNFCGKFTVNGNIYVNRESAFAPIPSGARIRGQIIL